jgi:hypothetical protein
MANADGIQPFVLAFKEEPEVHAVRGEQWERLDGTCQPE